MFGSSIFLNIALLTIIFLGPVFLRPKGPPPPHKMLEIMSENLDRADREIFAQTYVKYVDRLEENRKQMHAAVDAMTTALRADPVDPAAVQSTHDQMSLIRNGMDNLLAQFMVELSQELPLEARRNLKLFPHPPPPKH